MRLRLTATLVLAALIVAGVGGCRVVKVNTSPARHGTAGSATAPATASPSGAVVVNCLARSLCYAPRQFRAAYGIQPLLDRGITGRGQTVVLLSFPLRGQDRRRR
jgi:hypothetical protein